MKKLRTKEVCMEIEVAAGWWRPTVVQARPNSWASSALGCTQTQHECHHGGTQWPAQAQAGAHAGTAWARQHVRDVPQYKSKHARSHAGAPWYLNPQWIEWCMGGCMD